MDEHCKDMTKMVMITKITNLVVFNAPCQSDSHLRSPRKHGSRVTAEMRGCGHAKMAIDDLDNRTDDSLERSNYYHHDKVT